MVDSVVYPNAVLSKQDNTLVVTCLEYYFFPDNMTTSASLPCDCDVPKNLQSLKDSHPCESKYTVEPMKVKKNLQWNSIL